MIRMCCRAVINILKIFNNCCKNLIERLALIFIVNRRCIPINIVFFIFLSSLYYGTYIWNKRKFIFIVDVIILCNEFQIIKKNI